MRENVNNRVTLEAAFTDTISTALRLAGDNGETDGRTDGQTSMARDAAC